MTAEQEIHTGDTVQTTKPVEKRKPRKRSTRSIEYFMIVEVTSRHTVDPKTLRTIMDSVLSDIVRFVSFPLKQKNTFLVYARREKKKRVYEKVLTGVYNKLQYTCKLIDLKKYEESECNTVNKSC